VKLWLSQCSGYHGPVDFIGVPVQCTPLHGTNGTHKSPFIFFAFVSSAFIYSVCVATHCHNLLTLSLWYLVVINHETVAARYCTKSWTQLRKQFGCIKIKRGANILLTLR